MPYINVISLFFYTIQILIMNDKINCILFIVNGRAIRCTASLWALRCTHTYIRTILVPNPTF